MERIPKRLLPLILITLLLGCDEDKQVSQVATEAAERQAAQNREIAYQNRQISETTQALVAADAQSRKELIALQQRLEAQQAEVAKGHDLLEAERKEFAIQRHRDPIIAAAITSFAILLACLMPVVLAWHLLRATHDETVDPELTEVLIAELVAEQPLSPLALPNVGSATIAGPALERTLTGPVEPEPKEGQVD